IHYALPISSHLLFSIALSLYVLSYFFSECPDTLSRSLSPSTSLSLSLSLHLSLSLSRSLSLALSLSLSLSLPLFRSLPLPLFLSLSSIITASTLHLLCIRFKAGSHQYPTVSN